MSKNYFQILGIDESFIIDKEQLSKNLFSKQLEFHPDKHVNLSEEERVEALAISQIVNEAYQTLKSDFKRAEHILKINNFDPDREILDPEFLEESFKWREQLMESNNNNNLKEEIDREIEKTMQTLGDYLQKKLYDQGKKAYVRLKFLKRFLDEIEKIKSQ